VIYPDPGLTKLDVARYYERVADLILPHLEGRPTTLVRCPEGLGKGGSKGCFFQKHVGSGVPTTVRRVKVQEKEKVGEYVVVDSLPSLIALVQIGILELHTSNARADRLEQPDRLVFDLDPAPGIPWKRIAVAARTVRKELASLGFDSFLKTTGGKGLHVVLPLVRGPGWETCLAASRAIVQRIEAREPGTYVTVMSKIQRTGKIFLDYLRNTRGATSVAAYSVRARPGAPISLPISWDQLDDVDPKRPVFTVADVAVDRPDPWRGYRSTRQRLTAAVLRTLRVPS
jgi:bifunctional non-homologous end joining protein LigD